MLSSTRFGVITALMVLAACGGKVASVPIDDGGRDYKQPYGGDDDDDDDDDDSYPDPGVTPPSSGPYLVPITTDLESKSAAAICASRAKMTALRALGSFQIKSGWSELARSAGVEAFFGEGGMSSGGPIIPSRYLFLNFPVPAVVHPTGPTSEIREVDYRIEWPGSGDEEPSDFLQPGSTYELSLHDSSWTITCSSEGLAMQTPTYSYPLPVATVTITSRTAELVEGTVERKGPQGLESFTFKAPIPKTYIDWRKESQTVCCLDEY